MKELFSLIVVYVIIGGLLWALKTYSSFETMVWAGLTLTLLNLSGIKSILKEVKEIYDRY